MVFQDKDISCRDCSKPFVFSAGEQEFFHAKGLINEPKRCPNCRILMRVQRNGEDPGRTAEVNCAECGSPTRVPFPAQRLQARLLHLLLPHSQRRS